VVIEPEVIDKEAAARYLYSRQTPQGGYCSYRTPEWFVEEPNAPDTLAALASFRLLSLEPPKADLSAQWLQSLQAVDGSFATLTIGWAVLRALRLVGQAPAHPVDSWLTTQTLALLSSPGDGPEMVLRARRVADLLADQPLGREQVRLLAEKVLAQTKAPSGCWARPAADLVTTANACLLASVAHELAAVEEAAAYLRACEDPVIGLRITPRSHSSSVEVLWAGCRIALSLKEPLSYPDAIAARLAALQRSSGGFSFRTGGIPTLAATWPALATAYLLANHKGLPSASTAAMGSRLLE
jgi:hypothetical protein